LSEGRRPGDRAFFQAGFVNRRFLHLARTQFGPTRPNAVRAYIQPAQTTFSVVCRRGAGPVMPPTAAWRAPRGRGRCAAATGARGCRILRDNPHGRSHNINNFLACILTIVCDSCACDACDATAASRQHSHNSQVKEMR
jgi:hypothetical protein